MRLFAAFARERQRQRRLSRFVGYLGCVAKMRWCQVDQMVFSLVSCWAKNLVQLYKLGLLSNSGPWGKLPELVPQLEDSLTCNLKYRWKKWDKERNRKTQLLSKFSSFQPTKLLSFFYCCLLQNWIEAIERMSFQDLESGTLPQQQRQSLYSKKNSNFKESVWSSPRRRRRIWGGGFAGSGGWDFPIKYGRQQLLPPRQFPRHP